MNKPLVSFLLCVLTADIAMAQSYTATCQRPALPATLPGAPGPNTWTNDPVRVYEDDGLTGDDPMGVADGNGASASKRWDSTTMTLLLGEWLEFDCVEIDFYWTYSTWQKFTIPVLTQTGWAYVTQWRLVEQTICGQTQVICP